MKNLLAMLFLFWAGIAQGQTLISGRVSDSKTAPLPGANIFIKGSYDGTSSDASGNYSFTTSLSGKQILVVQSLGYKPYEESIQIESQPIVKNVSLSESINLLTAVTISAGAMEANDEKKTVVLKPIDIVTTSGAIGDITAAFQTLPGTSTVGNDGRLFVRGGDASETAIYMDGLQVGNAFGSTVTNVPTRNRFSANMFKGSFFSTGGYSAEFGQAMSSALALNTLDLPLRNQGDISVMSMGGGYSQTLVGKKNALTASGNYFNLAPYQSLVKQSFDWEKSPAGWDTEIALKQKWGKAGFIKAYFHTEAADMTIYQKQPGATDRGQRVALRNGYTHGNISFRQAGKKDWFFTGGLAFSYNRDKIKLDQLPVEQITQLFHAKFVAIKDFKPGFSLKNGVETYVKAYGEEITDTHKRREETDNQFNHFIETSYHFSNNLVGVAGLRSGYSTLAKEYWLTPRFSLAYKLNKGQISAAYGQFRQLPDGKFRVLDRNLQNSEASHYILNYFLVNDNRTLRAEAFYKTYDKLLTYTGSTLYPQNIKQDGNGYARGFDVFFRDKKTVKSTDFWVTYSFVDSKRRFATFETKVQPSFAPKHNGSVVVKHFVSALKSQLGGSWSWNSGYTYTDPNMSGEMQKITPMYSNLSLSWSWLPKQNIIVHAACTNVLGRNNVFGYQYTTSPDTNGKFASLPTGQGAKRFAFLGLFITLSKDKQANNLNNL